MRIFSYFYYHFLLELLTYIILLLIVKSKNIARIIGNCHVENILLYLELLNIR